MNSPSATQARQRIDLIDAGRGLAILLMFIYHFCYDLDYYGFIQQDFDHDPFWTRFRIVIVSLFLLLVGISLRLATQYGINPRRYLRRLGLLILYACLVSLSTWIMFPKAAVFFGILHFIALASILGLLFTRLGSINLWLGIALIFVGLSVEHPFFNQPLWQWIGLMTHLPRTVDYVPLLPWFGVVLIGIYLGQQLHKLPQSSPLRRWQTGNKFDRSLVLAGRHSLHIYMLHQPLFMGILYIVYKLWN